MSTSAVGGNFYGMQEMQSHSVANFFGKIWANLVRV